MSISVAMAVRNGTRHLEPLLDSLCRQSVLPAELVVCDDASDDGGATVRAVEAFAKSAPFPVRLIRNDRQQGPTETFLRAAAACRCDLVAYCDADDVWVESKLERCERALERRETMLACHAARLIDAEGRDLGRTWPDPGPTRVVPRLGFTGLHLDAPGMAMVWRRSLLGAADFGSRPPSRFGGGRRMLHDEWTLFLAGALGEVAVIGDPLVLYRQHGANDSGGWVRRERRMTLAPVVEDYRRAAEHTAACADYLAGAAANAQRDRAEHLADAADAYRRTAEAWATRLELYDARERRLRARLMRRLVRLRAYRHRRSGGFGRRALCKDLVAGVALGIRGDGR